MGDTEPRVVLSVRLAPSGIAKLDEDAAELKVPRAVYARALLAEALRSESVRTAARNRLRGAL